jgi:hypothetical protein
LGEERETLCDRMKLPDMMHSKTATNLDFFICTLP